MNRLKRIGMQRPVADNPPSSVEGRRMQTQPAPGIQGCVLPDDPQTDQGPSRKLRGVVGKAHDVRGE
jgi:hypothetical protein